ncbi:DUF3300 domain-containing protein [Methylococcus mesophilus]|uniref:DUF3300 domain-containing protein n=1 Tax=Methylococcus mesophilus TaxID=2993564 RepID=UPI00224B58CE|nr:DUF3300 domain-containing protein [Methylococcus mesophilus]UZR29643.1 DUF3300 domain-containing protein [Methylococcus mesophilus]
MPQRNSIRPALRALPPLLLVSLAHIAAVSGTALAAPGLAAGPGATPSSGSTPPEATRPPADAGHPLTEIESLVAPVALYPDPLLAEMLVASTYPLEVVQASRWLGSHPEPSAVKDKDWDASIQRLIELPSIIKMMNDHLEWTTQLGDAFLAKPAELMDAIQSLRQRARESGFLKDSAEQKVTTKTVPSAAGTEVQAPEGQPQATPATQRKEVIGIEPAKPDTVYVPQYNPEQVYSAPLASPPYAYPAAAPAGGYAYYPAPTPASTTSGTDPWMTFGAGALIGGLLTWGIMEWADDDDWHGYYGGYYPPVSHYYGNAVCRSGSCWYGGGSGGVAVDRGDVNRNRNINISGNEINIDRDGTFRQDRLKDLRQRTDWTPDPRHRRGQPYPEPVKQRLGQTAQPGLAGDRRGVPDALPADRRGFGKPGEWEGPPGQGGERRPSSAEIRSRLAQGPDASVESAGALAQNRGNAEMQSRSKRGSGSSSLEGVRTAGSETRIESRRGAQSRRTESLAGFQQRLPEPSGERLGGQSRSEQRQRLQAPDKPQSAERRIAAPQPGQALGGGRNPARQGNAARMGESNKPNAFEGMGETRRTQNFSQRGAASRANMGAANRQNRGGGGERAGLRGGGGRRR